MCGISPFINDSILNARNGKPTGILRAELPPAFWQDSTGKHFELSLNGRSLRSIDVETGNIVWSFSGDRALSSAPLVINNIVVIGSAYGELYLLDAATGAKVWSTNLGVPIIRSGEQQTLGRPWTGLGAGQNTLVVPASNLIAAFVPE
jgi:outer membrane protein assembly factor BamB